ncbi:MULTISPECIES: FUSC family protein [Rhodopseudomonas]|uniref:FUSC family protein n=1 Tax=Rhodopseudomonas TaxID=1073 RepID=UPI001F44C254|nr:MULTISPECIES: FUSC family protein [Rhodopseudomonas]MDF3813460.1 FUSC family protein [Rhodopseudomonas sp. BAL398]WOK18713.1 FUSC family protein [Rhodopseudomonas sp. BAL398]
MLAREWRHLTTINQSDRPWQMPFAAALASGVPLLIGALFDRLDYGLVSSLGGMAFIYLPATPLHHRMVSLMAVGFGMIACYAFGIIAHFFPLLLTPVLGIVAILVSMVCRFYRVGPPGSLFFVMAASIAAYSPSEVMQVPLKVGLLAMGSLLAALIAFVYSVGILRLRSPQPVAPLPPATFDFVVFDSVVIGVSVGISLTLAQLLQLERPYWVPVSCLAVIQGLTLRAVWTRQLHRLLGTALGLLLAWALLALPLDKWSIALLVIALSFIIESAVMRHYGFAVIFITPLTIFLADAATLGHGTPNTVIEARLIDTLLGCAVGLAGGFCLHSPTFRAVVGRQMRRLVPARFSM